MKVKIPCNPSPSQKEKKNLHEISAAQHNKLKVLKRKDFTLTPNPNPILGQLLVNQKN